MSTMRLLELIGLPLLGGSIGLWFHLVERPLLVPPFLVLYKRIGLGQKAIQRLRNTGAPLTQGEA